MRVLAIDEGTVQSGYCLVEDYIPISSGKSDNHNGLAYINTLDYDVLVIEKIKSYGMPVGQEVFDTCVWAGRFIQLALQQGKKVCWISRIQEKLNLCNSAKANDASIKQAICDRFAPLAPNHGKGTKDNPSIFYGFKADVWSAYAIAVTYLDLSEKEREYIC